MSYFLWIEDFDNEPNVTVSQVFGNVLNENIIIDNRYALRADLRQNGIFVELSFQDGLKFIRENLKKIDYVILDIDLPAYSQGDLVNNSVLELLEKFEGYHKSDNEIENEQLLIEKCNELRHIAGFYLYTELVVELGFPKKHILFCSNHGETTIEIQNAFRIAKIDLPRIYLKSADEVKELVGERYENDYTKLRRGIIEGCDYLKTLKVDNYRFNEFIKKDDKKNELKDLANYIGVLETLLPLQEPDNKEHFYKLFIRTLAHEWEAAEPKRLDNQQELFAFSWIMKMSRNWLAHTNIFDQLSSQDVAYLFLINIRTMFKFEVELRQFEKILLSLFEETPEDEFRNIVGNSHRDRQIPLVQNYAQSLNIMGQHYQAINFHNALNNIQQFGQGVPNEFLITGLYQVFWFLTSNASVCTNNLGNSLNYQFRYFNYHQNTNDYLFEFSRHIYNRSFLN